MTEIQCVDGRIFFRKSEHFSRGCRNFNGEYGGYSHLSEPPCPMPMANVVNLIENKWSHISFQSFVDFSTCSVIPKKNNCYIPAMAYNPPCLQTKPIIVLPTKSKQNFLQGEKRGCELRLDIHSKEIRRVNEQDLKVL